MEIRLVDQVECVEIARRRIARFRSGNIETDNAVVAIADGELGNLNRTGELAHCGDDEAHRYAGLALASLESAQDRLDCLVERKAIARAELGCVANLGVNDAVACQVLS